MAKLTARKRAYPIGMGDGKRDGALRLEEWRSGLSDVLELLAKTGSLGDGVPGSGDAMESDEEEEMDDDGEVLLDEPAEPKASKLRSAGSIEDVEDLGRIMESRKGMATAARLRERRSPLILPRTENRKRGRRRSRRLLRKWCPRAHRRTRP